MDATELNAMYAGKLDELTKVYEKTITMLKIAKEPKNTTEEEMYVIFFVSNVLSWNLLKNQQKIFT